MSTFDDDERSVAHSRPTDLYVISTPTQTYRLTSHVVDVTYLGNVYTATTMSRGNQTIAQDLTGREMVVYLPISHPVVQRFAAFGVPEHEVVVTQFRLQERSGVAQQGWSGFANALTITEGTEGGYIAMLRIPSITDDAFKIRLPSIGGQKLCNHRLGDSLCTVNLDLAASPTQITSITDLTVTLAAPGTGTHHVFGDIVHHASGQRRMCIRQTEESGVQVLWINTPFVDVAIGDSVTAFPGCDHTVLTCRDKFSNVINFGGHPDLNATINPWAPNGFGVTQQE